VIERQPFVGFDLIARIGKDPTVCRENGFAIITPCPIHT